MAPRWSGAKSKSRERTIKRVSHSRSDHCRTVIAEDLILGNGSEFAGHALDVWAFQLGVTLYVMVFPGFAWVG